MGCDAPPPPAAHSQDTKVSFHSFLFVTPPVPYYSVYLAYASSRARGLAPAGRNVPSCIQNPRQEFRFSASPSPFVSHIALLRIGRHPGSARSAPVHQHLGAVALPRSAHAIRRTRGEWAG